METTSKWYHIDTTYLPFLHLLVCDAQPPLPPLILILLHIHFHHFHFQLQGGIHVYHLLTCYIASWPAVLFSLLTVFATLLCHRTSRLIRSLSSLSFVFVFVFVFVIIIICLFLCLCLCHHRLSWYQSTD